MKKFLPIIIGVFVGISVSGLLIVSHVKNVAFGEENKAGWWDSFIAGADQDWFDWKDVFSPFGPSEKGRDLYNLIYKKLARSSEKDAVKEIAQKNGLTNGEAQSVINGSTSIIMDNANRRGGALTQGKANILVANLQKDYADLKELLQTEQEINVAIAPGEIFANGDLSDSGFDLVEDLGKIEEILFVQKTPNTVGALYKEAYKSPFSPTDKTASLDNYVASSTPAEVSGSTAGGAGSANFPLEVDGSGETGAGEVIAGETAVYGNEQVEVLKQDICETNNSLNTALNNFAQDQGKNNGSEVSDSETTESAAGTTNASGADDAGEFGIDSEKNGVPSGEKAPLNEAGNGVKSAPSEDWAKTWCPGSQDTPTFAGMGAAGFKSLTGVAPLLATGGVAAGIDTEALAAKVALCFDIQIIKKKVSSYQPGDSCILCEVKKINEFLDKTLSHSLIPNKATGNLLESAKCKQAAQVPLLNLQFITIWNPVPTPTNDDLIFGRNIFEEWNKFAQKYQPLLLNKISFDAGEGKTQSQQFQLELEQQSAPSEISQSALFDRINRTRAKYKADAAVSVKNFDNSNDVANFMVYSRNVLKEMNQMNALFANFKETFGKISTQAVPQILNKPNID